MDCGPATLKCLLEGFGIPVSYGRLREACQTDVDGTSINVLEEVAGQLGLDAQQIMLPADFVLLDEAEALPAIVVIRNPDGMPHFVLAWRRHGPVMQLMDPGTGRRWVSTQRFAQDLFVHAQRIPAAAWEEWARGEGFLKPLTARLKSLGLGRHASRLIDTALAAPGWRALAALDAVTRLTHSLVDSGGVAKGNAARKILEAFVVGHVSNVPVHQQPAGHVENVPHVPDPFWSARPAPSDADGNEQLEMRGAVLVRVHGRREVSNADDGDSEKDSGPLAADRTHLNPELAAALNEPQVSTAKQLWRLMGGGATFGLLLLAMLLGALATTEVLEGLLLRGLLDVGRSLTLIEQRLLAVGAFTLLGVGVIFFELRAAGALNRLGRRIETALRVEFLRKIPRLHDRYFQSRPVSDMAERSHSLHQIRTLPKLFGQMLRSALVLLFTVAAIAWVDPSGVVWAALAAVSAIGIPLLCLPLLQGLDLRARTHDGALSRFYLDALIGLNAIRSHGAATAVRREHEGLMVEWAKAAQKLLCWSIAIEGLQSVVGTLLAVTLLMRHSGTAVEMSGALLLAYWVLNLPTLGEQLAMLIRQVPSARNATLRALEPLGAPEESSPVAPRQDQPNVSTAFHSQSKATAPSAFLSRSDRATGITLDFQNVTVRAGGQTILHDLTLSIPAGSHVAIVGASGSGKSTFVGLLLGWYRAAEGKVLVDGERLDTARLDQLRVETAWVDPAVQLWNRSLIDNVLYGQSASRLSELGPVLERSDLTSVLRRLPDGMQTVLGEAGGRLSGGEGQRVRLARAFAREGTRLAILDEPFRGLDRGQRGELLLRAREHWRGATLLCVTHDVGETLDFERVLVVEAGRVIEDAPPRELAARPDSQFRKLLDAEVAVREGLWTDARWRQTWLCDGQLEEVAPQQLKLSEPVVVSPRTNNVENSSGA